VVIQHPMLMMFVAMVVAVAAMSVGRSTSS